MKQESLDQVVKTILELGKAKNREALQLILATVNTTLSDIEPPWVSNAECGLDQSMLAPLSDFDTRKLLEAKNDIDELIKSGSRTVRVDKTAYSARVILCIFLHLGEKGFFYTGSNSTELCFALQN